MLVVFNFISAPAAARLVMYAIPYFIIGYDILIKAFKGIKNRQPFDEAY